MVAAKLFAGARKEVERTMLLEAGRHVPLVHAGKDQTWPEGGATDIRFTTANPRQSAGAAAMRELLGNEPGATLHVSTALAVKVGDRIEAATGRRFEVVFVAPGRETDLLRPLVCRELRPPGAS